MKILSLATLLLPTCTSAFSMNMNGQRSPLAQQYKSITSIHNSMLSGSGSGIRMAPPPGEPEPEVRFFLIIICLKLHRHVVVRLDI